VELVENAQTPDEEIDSEYQQFIQHITKEEGERGSVEQNKTEDVLQIPSTQEQKIVEEIDRNPFQVGERIIDVLTKIQGVVVGVDKEKVFFYCQELGRVWRQCDLLMKI
jgi:hypothetical protein